MGFTCLSSSLEPSSSSSSHGDSRGTRWPSEKFMARLWALSSSATDESKPHDEADMKGRIHQAIVRPCGKGRGENQNPSFNLSQKERRKMKDSAMKIENDQMVH